MFNADNERTINLNHSPISKTTKNVFLENIDLQSTILKSFIEYRNELDLKHDKSERIVKLSRDITIESKRIIFLLHRFTKEDTSTIINEAKSRLQVLENTKWKSIALELKDEDCYQFLKHYSSGLQEYIEAISLLWYLTDKKLVNLTEVINRLSFKYNDETQLCTIEVPISEFSAGVADLAGELTRLAINSIGAGDFEMPKQVCWFLRSFHHGLSLLGGINCQFSRKLNVAKQSLTKVENACYTLQIRGTEAPKEFLKQIISYNVEQNDNTVD